MLEQMKYQNHLNEVIDFGKNGILVKASDLHDYAWAVSQKNDKISAFKRGVTNRTLPVTILAQTPEEGVAARNRLMEIAEKDVLAKEPGRLIIGDYYYRCYVTASKKTSYLQSRRLMQANLTITTDKPYWVKETTHVFRKGAAAAGRYLDFAFDYPFDYVSNIAKSALVNSDFTGTNFRMIIYGACSHPVVYVSGHAYAVNCDVADGEYLTIDSAAKTVTRTAINGAKENVFDLRGRDAYIFERIPVGESTVTWDGVFSVDIILLEERSEPKWT